MYEWIFQEKITWWQTTIYMDLIFLWLVHVVYIKTPYTLHKQIIRMKINSVIQVLNSRAVTNGLGKVKVAQKKVGIAHDFTQTDSSCFVRFYFLGFSHKLKVWRQEKTFTVPLSAETGDSLTRRTLLHLLPLWDSEGLCSASAIKPSVCLLCLRLRHTVRSSNLGTETLPLPNTNASETLNVHSPGTVQHSRFCLRMNPS